MVKQKFGDESYLNKKDQNQLKIINKIINEYAEQGYKLTLRQLYYQLVSRDIIPNQKKEYAKLSKILVKGRMAGIVDWKAIEDRTRRPFLSYWVNDIEDAIEDTIDRYKLNRQKGQNVYLELWVEKDALSGILRKMTSYYHINLMVNRGYSSCTAMHNAYKRLKRHEGVETYLLYLGDHDPSGLDMIRDIKKRLNEFGVHPEIKHIGLTKKQIDKYNPPPNPTKITDPRVDWYIKNFGNTCWEVDALKPGILNELVKRNIEELIDLDLFKKQLEQEKKDKEQLRNFLNY